MGGGRASQLGFYYQNLFCIRKILKALRNGLVRAKVDQKLRDFGMGSKEVDLILEYKNGSKVVKSRLVSTGNAGKMPATPEVT